MMEVPSGTVTSRPSIVSVTVVAKGHERQVCRSRSPAPWTSAEFSFLFGSQALVATKIFREEIQRAQHGVGDEPAQSA